MRSASWLFGAVAIKKRAILGTHRYSSWAEAVQLALAFTRSQWAA
jgi:hypothetical protein